MTSICACCGVPIPEGRKTCPKCDTWGVAPDAFLPDGTPLYFKTVTKSEDCGSLQLALYDLLMKGK